MSKKKKRLLIILSSVLLVLAIAFGGVAIYLSDYYRAEDGAIATFLPSEGITSSVLDNGSVVFKPENPVAGFIFYPGGKVEHNAYQPLMAALAREGVLCVLVQMPFNLAVFNVNAADGIKESYPEVEEWYIGGHSLGGSMAAAYLESHADGYEGLVLLGAYSTADLSDSGIKVLSVFGSEDKVMNREKYDECRTNLPEALREVEITGGCHAYFGAYGAQAGDGTPTISRDEQIRITAESILKMIEN